MTTVEAPPISSAKYSLTGSRFYAPVGSSDYAPIASTTKGVYTISLAKFGLTPQGETVYRVWVTKPIAPCGKTITDHRFTDLVGDAIPEYEGLVDEYIEKEKLMWKRVTGRR